MEIKQMGFVKQLQILADCVIPLQLVKNNDATYDTLDNQYVESGLFGINKASKDKETAKEFLKYILSEEIQSGNTLDGFPVNVNSLESLMTNEKALDGVSVALSTEAGTEIFTEPEVEQIQQLYEKMKLLDKPISYDCTLSELIIEETAKYLEGGVSKEEAIQNMTNTVSRYLAE